MGTLNLSNGVSLSSTGTAFGNSAASWSDAPPGTVIQVVDTSTSGEMATSSTSYQNFMSITWTPRMSNSHKLITVLPIRIWLGNGVEGNYKIYDGSNDTPRYRINQTSGSSMSMSPILSWYWPQTHTAGQSVTFYAQGRNGSAGNGTLIWGDNGATSRMIIQEIAQ